MSDFKKDASDFKTETIGHLQVSYNTALERPPGALFTLPNKFKLSSVQEVLQRHELEELYQLLGDILGKASTFVGFNENTLIATWESWLDGEEVTRALTREEAASILTAIGEDSLVDWTSAHEVLEENLRDYADKKGLWSV